MTGEQTITLKTQRDTLGFDAHTGSLVSFRSGSAPDQEFIQSRPDDPTFVIQYLDEKHAFRQITSRQAAGVALHTAVQGNATTFTMDFRHLGDLDLDVTVAVQVGKDDPFSHWSLRLKNGAGIRITDVQFPFVVVPYHLAGTPGTEAIVWPYGPGVLFQSPKPWDLAPDDPHTWQMRPENSDAMHYPGFTGAQFLAYYNGRAGLYVACLDTQGYVKLIKPVHHEPGCRLGFAHVGDWPERGERSLEYDMVMGSFTGDWYAAAGIYREWSIQQHWAAKPLHSRTDIPAWLLDSPPHIIVRIQGELDFGPAEPNEAFLPYAKTIPLLEKIAQRLESPLVPVIMSWERPGPWVYPDCFPPAGGEDSLREFCAEARERGWHIGTFCNGTRWVVGHYWSGYNGEDDFFAKGGDRSVCRTHRGDLWKENWDPTWRPSYAGCLGTRMTRDIAANFVRQVADYGLDWIQFLDQNIGCATFPCYATDHEHPPVPGRWMTEKMERLVEIFRAQATETAERSAGQREMAFSVEVPINEYFLPGFAICDVRVVPPGHGGPGSIGPGNFIPLYHFLYHEFILIQAGFGSGPEPYHMPIRTAYNWVIGEIPGAVMIGDGTLLNKDTWNWAPWENPVGSNEDSLTMLRAATILRRGPAKDFLTFGRMTPPAQVKGIRMMRWQHGGRDNQIPAVFHATWQAPNGRLGWTLANWTNEWQEVTVNDARLSGAVSQTTATQTVESNTHTILDGSLTLALPPLSCILLENHLS